MSEYISKTRLFAELKNRKGLIPFEIEEEQNILKWIDLEQYHIYEGFFHKSVNMFSRLKTGKRPVQFFTTDLDVLQDERVLTDSIYPTGFIFHTGRAGSTLLAKAFARSRENLVLSEVPAHNKIWFDFSEKGRITAGFSEENKTVYTNLILAGARKRISSHRNCFIKFTSYNIFFYNFIREIFPDVPAVFLYRKPSGILSSIEKRPTGWNENHNLREFRTRVLEKEYKNLDMKSYLNRIIFELFSAALKINDNKLYYYNFKNLTAENFHVILDFLNLTFQEEELNKMKSQFNYYSKSEDKLVRFSKDRIEELHEEEENYIKNVSPELGVLYERLGQKESAQSGNKTMLTAD